jgi:hypothetical protein
VGVGGGGGGGGEHQSHHAGCRRREKAEAFQWVAATACLPISSAAGAPLLLQSKRLLIESRWVSKPLAFAGTLRPPQRLNS